MAVVERPKLVFTWTSRRTCYDYVFDYSNMTSFQQDGAAYAITVYKKEWNTDANKGWMDSVPIDMAIPQLHGLEPR